MKRQLEAKLAQLEHFFPGLLANGGRPMTFQHPTMQEYFAATTQECYNILNKILRQLIFSIFLNDYDLKQPTTAGKGSKRHENVWNSFNDFFRNWQSCQAASFYHVFYKKGWYSSPEHQRTMHHSPTAKQDTEDLKKLFDDVSKPVKDYATLHEEKEKNN